MWGRQGRKGRRGVSLAGGVVQYKFSSPPDESLVNYVQYSGTSRVFSHIASRPQEKQDMRKNKTTGLLYTTLAYNTGLYGSSNTTNICMKDNSDTGPPGDHMHVYTTWFT